MALLPRLIMKCNDKEVYIYVCVCVLYVQVIGKEMTIQGFALGNHAATYEADFYKDMLQYFREGKIKVKEHITEGLENVGKAFLEMMRGDNVGKAVVRVSD
jgi:NADPH-dependent curcumin reductase CurA